MSQITFTGCYIRYADLRMPEGGQVHAIAHLTGNLTKPVMKAMEWEDVPDCVDSAKLEGILTARSLVLTPNDEQLARNEISLECSQVSDFTIVRVENKDCTSKRTELRFTARVNEDAAIARIEQYARVAGRAPGTLKVTCQSQQALPMEEEKARGASA